MSRFTGQFVDLRDEIIEKARVKRWSELSVTGRVIRVVNIAFLISTVGMAWSANTANSDWNLTQDDVQGKFPS